MITTTPVRLPESPEERQRASPRLASTARHLTSWQWWAASGSIFAISAAGFFATRAPFSIPTVESACGQAPLDVRFYSTAAEVNGFLAACGADGRVAYTNMQLADLAYPAVFGLFMLLSLVATLRRLNLGHRTLLAVAALPLLGTAFDYAENVFAWRALRAFPEPTGTDGLLGLASAAKTTAFWLAGLLLLAGLVVVAGRTLRAHVRRQSTGFPSTEDT